MVYFASHNIISSLGFTSGENIENISKNISGVKLCEHKSLGPLPAHVSLVDENILNSKFETISNGKNYTKFEKLLLLSAFEALSQTKINIKSKSSLIIISTTKGNINLLEEKNKKLFEADRVQLYKISEIVQDFFETENKPQIISNACISGTLALAVAQRFIQQKKYENILVVGADIISEFTLSGFLSFKAVGSSICKPFDKLRDGINLGEAAASIILTSNSDFAIKPYVYLRGASSTNDANHISGPSRTGDELAKAITNSLLEAGFDSADIDYISAHGTATLYNDEMEAKAFETAKISNAYATSFKPYVGHTLGAAGILETVTALFSILNNEIYATPGFSELGVPANINVCNSYKKQNVNTVVKTASGFGGCNAALVISDKLPIKKEINSNKILKIIKTISIQNNILKIDDKKIFELKDADFKEFIKALYKNFDIKYPKFFKMDSLSKLAFLATDILLSDQDIKTNISDYESSIILSNRDSSLDTDVKYQESVNDKDNYFPAPSLFVYTLANVMAGEICIKHKIKGENTVFVSEYFDTEFITDYVQIIFNQNKSKIAITGRVDFSYPEANYQAKLALVSESENGISDFNKENLKNI